MKKDWEKIGKLILKIMGNILYCSCFMWLAVNLLLLAFKIPFKLTILQAISLCFFSVMWGAVFGSSQIGGKSK